MSRSRTPSRVLVAGGAGFLGTNLCKALLDRGCHVDCIDNLITGTMRNVELLQPNPAFSFFRCNIASPLFHRMFQNVQYDEIYHLACPTGVPNIARLGEEMMAACSQGTLNLLRLARSCDARFLYVSSAEVYGDPKVFPQDEAYHGDVDPVGPRSAYEEGKRFGETLVALYSKKHHVDGRVVRVFNTYGRYMSLNDQRVIPQFLSRALKHEPIVVYGDGNQTRTFLYVDDLVRGLFTIMENGGSGEVYNIGGDTEITIRELLGHVAKQFDFQLEIQYKPHFTTDHSRRKPAIGKVSSLGWAPSISLDDGLRFSLADMADATASFARLSQSARSSRPVRPKAMALDAEAAPVT